jgi:hypothetical protein
MILTEARALAIKEILPTLAVGDKRGWLRKGQRCGPRCVSPGAPLILEGEWQGLGIPAEIGGQGAPGFVAMPARNIFWPPITPCTTTPAWATAPPS